MSCVSCHLNLRVQKKYLIWLHRLFQTGEIGLVIDSLGMMVSQQEMEKDIEESTYGGISRALTKFSKKIELAVQRTVH